MLVLRGRMSRASARRVSTGFGIAGNYRVPTTVKLVQGLLDVVASTKVMVDLLLI